MRGGLRWLGIVATFVMVLTTWPCAGRAAGVTVELEHLVIMARSGSSQEPYEVLDVVRWAADGGAQGGEAATLRIPLPEGVEALQVRGGFDPSSVRTASGSVSGTVVPDGPDATSGSVAVSFRVSRPLLERGMRITRPHAVGTLAVMVDPAVPIRVEGASAGETVEMGGQTLKVFVRDALAPGESVTVTLVPAPWWGAGAAWGGVAVAAIMAAGGGLLLLRRRQMGATPEPGTAALERTRRRVRRQLVEAIVHLDAEFGAGYLEAPAYRARRQALVESLAALDATGASAGEHAR